MLNLDFSSAITDTVEDKDLEGTGFTSIQTNTNSDQYNPTRINLDPTAGTQLSPLRKEVVLELLTRLRMHSRWELMLLKLLRLVLV